MREVVIKNDSNSILECDISEENLILAKLNNEFVGVISYQSLTGWSLFSVIGHEDHYSYESIASLISYYQKIGYTFFDINSKKEIVLDYNNEYYISENLVSQDEAIFVKRNKEFVGIVTLSIFEGCSLWGVRSVKETLFETTNRQTTILRGLKDGCSFFIELGNKCE